MSGFYSQHRPPYGLFPPFSQPPPPTVPVPSDCPPSKQSLISTAKSPPSVPAWFPPIPSSIPVPGNQKHPPPLPQTVPRQPHQPPPCPQTRYLNDSPVKEPAAEFQPQNQQSTDRAADEPVRPGLGGVKRKHLAKILLDSEAATHHVSWTAEWDTEMPAELMEKCQPLYCELCSCACSSPLQAKMHYEGKSHAKHVRRYFLTAGVSEMNLPQKMDPSSGKFPKRETLRCDVCDLQFTSVPCLNQHLEGKNHKKKMEGQDSKRATFNKETKKWEKTTNRDVLEIPSERNDASSALFCELCKVNASSKSQLDMHLNGKSHKKKMEKSMGGVSNNDLNLIEKRMKFKESVLNTMQRLPLRKGAIKNFNESQTGTGGKDYSIYRTPSGNYYCASCNVTVNNVSQFEMHIASKKHKQKDLVHKSRR